MTNFFKNLTILKSILITFILIGVIFLLVLINIKFLRLDFNTASLLSQFVILVIIITIYCNYFFQDKDINFSLLNALKYSVLGFIIGSIYYTYQFIFNDHVTQQYEITIPLLLEIVLVGVLYEEVFFRGIILKGLLKNYNPYIAVFISALLFSLSHITQICNPLKFMNLLILGFICSVSYVKNKNILIPILIHASYNIGILILPNFFLFLTN